MIKKVLGVLVLGAALIWVFQTVISDPKEPPGGATATPANSISDAEKALIEAWLKSNDLNQYGDPKDTVYIGGTPIFDEKTGETINRYDYILRNHPQRPWGK